MNPRHKISKRWLQSGSEFSRLLNLLIFVALTLLIHYGFRWWAYEAHYKVLGQVIITEEFLQRMGTLVFNNARWLVMDLLGIHARIEGQIIYMPDGGGVAVDGACSGLKQMLQFALLILPLPGPWRHKAWFIPAGIVVIHAVNVFRVFGLCLVMMWDPSTFSFFHDYILRPLFYLVIFGLWLFWTEVIRIKS